MAMDAGRAKSDRDLEVQMDAIAPDYSIGGRRDLHVPETSQQDQIVEDTCFIKNHERNVTTRM